MVAAFLAWFLHSGFSNFFNFVFTRNLIVKNQLILICVLQTELLNLFLNFPLYLFATPEYKNLTCFGFTLPLIHNQTIWPPYIVALMSQTSELGKMV
tara:strand:- start:541 stop:831 length:291 start_codon:yes stop_codon:yes gene_type:complete